MPLARLKIPPGVYRPGTRYAAAGRWYAANLVRWVGVVMEAVGGWTPLMDTSADPDAPVTLGEAVRGMLAWRGNGGETHVAFGGPTSLYRYVAGYVHDLTPADFTAGLTDSGAVAGAYGTGAYGMGLYGTGDSEQDSLAPAQTWQMDNFGQDLVAVARSDRRILYWSPTDGDILAYPLPGSPPSVTGVVVTPERFVVALGAGGDARKVQWASQELGYGLPDVATDPWNPLIAGSSAGYLPVADEGTLVCGRRGQGETLIWTTQGLHALRYIGGELVYSLRRVAGGCGIIAPMAAGVLGSRAYWMGRESFFVYDGGIVQTLPCEVQAEVFADINTDQAEKIACRVVSDFGEVTWHYPSAGSTENDKYVTWSERGWWAVGALERTSGVDAGPTSLPLAADASGAIYEHETGSSYLDTDGETALTPYAESGPVEIADGQVTMDVLRLIPDEETLGGAQLSVMTGDFPTDAETTHGPYAAAQPVFTRFAGRTVRVKVQQATAGWRYGSVKLDVVPAGER